MKLNFLKEKGQEQNKISTQRVSLFGALVGIMYLIGVTGVYILKRGDSTEGIGESEWIGMSLFVAGLLAGLGINAGVKAWQKKFEK